MKLCEEANAAKGAIERCLYELRVGGLHMRGPEKYFARNVEWERHRIPRIDRLITDFDGVLPLCLLFRDANDQRSSEIIQAAAIAQKEEAGPGK